MKKYALYALMGIATLSACSKDEGEDIGGKFNTNAVQESPDFLDERDGNVYKTIRIGNQIWMTENLRYAVPGHSTEGCFTWEEVVTNLNNLKPDEKYLIAQIRDIATDEQYEGWPIEIIPGFSMSLTDQIVTMLNRVESGRMTAEDARTTIAIYSPEFEEILAERLLNYASQPEVRYAAAKAASEKADEKAGGYVAKYGYLYSHAAALKAVPEGWRLPSDEDWSRLEQTLGLSSAEANRLEAWRGEGLATLLGVGGAAKFNAQKAGTNAYCKEASQLYMNKDRAWYYWSSTTTVQNDSIPVALIRMSSDFNTKVWRGTCRLDNVYRKVLNSVRCVKDAE